MGLLKDEKLKNGFKLKGLNSIRDGHGAVKLFKTSEFQPDWFLCQWNSKYNFLAGNFVVSNDKYSIADTTKDLTVFKDGTVKFTLLAGKEYDKPRQEWEPWPHLLIEQEITENNKVKDMRSIKCSATVSLDAFRDYMGKDRQEHHTAQFVWVVTFCDSNPQSPSYGAFIWVVMCPYDSRREYAHPWMQQDTAVPNGQFIYSFDGREFMDRPLTQVGTSAKMEIDLYARLPEILAKAQSCGFMKGTKIEDLEISSTNMGFEITGTFDCEITVRDFKIAIE